MRNILKASTVLALLSPFMALAADARPITGADINNWGKVAGKDSLTVFLEKIRSG
jgi:hypothetical protein